MRVDLHLHTYYSADAEGTPEAALKVAREACIDIVAFAEHNTCAHIDSCLTAAADHVNPRCLAATEISCTTRFTANREIHLLCYFVGPSDAPWRSGPFLRLTTALAAIQRENVGRIVRAAGIPDDDVEKAMAWCFERGAVHSSVAPSIYMVKRGLKALATTEATVAARALSTARKSLLGSSGLVPYPDVVELRDLIGRADTRWFLAHPERYEVTDCTATQMLTQLTEMGLAGIETHSLAFMYAEQRWRSIAERRDLLMSAGTDLHSFAGVSPERYAELADTIALPSTRLRWLTVDGSE